MSKVTLGAVARRAQVSEATVSRVLNKKPGVAESTRRAVLTALDVLGYDRPAGLRSRTGSLVGLIIPELLNPIFPAFAQSLENLLSRNGFTAVLCTQTAGGPQEDEYVAMLLDRGVSGIVFVSGLHANTQADPARYHRLRASGLPIVLVNGLVDTVQAPCVSHDDVASVSLAVSHLRSLGHRRIGLAIGPTRYVPAARMLAGYEAVMAASGDELLVQRTQYTVEGGAVATRALLDAGATAVVCGSDLMALGAVRAARAQGLRVPEDLSVVGHDDSQLMAFTDPPLTTIRQAVEAMSQAAVSALVEEITGNGGQEGEYLFAPELVVRGSTAPVRPA